MGEKCSPNEQKWRKTGDVHQNVRKSWTGTWKSEKMPETLKESRNTSRTEESPRRKSKPVHGLALPAPRAAEDEPAVEDQTTAGRRPHLNNNNNNDNNNNKSRSSSSSNNNNDNDNNNNNNNK